MPLFPMAPGGRWMRPPNDGPAVYVPAKQIESHYKRLVGENWSPIDDPRSADGVHVEQTHEPVMTAREVSMQAQIDQLTALVHQLIAQKAQPDGSTSDTGGTILEESTDSDKQVRRVRKVN